MPVVRDNEAERLAQIEQVLERIQRQQQELGRLIRQTAALRKQGAVRRAPAKSAGKRKQR